MMSLTQNELREALRIVADELGYTDGRGTVLPQYIPHVSFVELIIRRAYRLDDQPKRVLPAEPICGVCGLRGTIRVFDRDDCPGFAGCLKVEQQLEPRF